MKTKLFIASILLFSFLVSCKNKNKTSYDMVDTQLSELKKTAQEPNDNENRKQIPVGDFQQNATDSAIVPLPVKAVSNPDWDKKIIKTATLKLEVKDFKNYNTSVRNTVSQFGGYIAQEEQNLTDERSETVISIKVPVEQFEPMMNQLPAGDAKVLERRITTEDVTGEVVDTRSRLEAKKQMRVKYLEFLKQSKNMEEVLQVQNEINSIQEEIESAAGRVAFLSHQSSYSTINLTFYQPINGYKPSDGTPSFFTRVSGAFKTGGSWITEFFIGLVSIWPLLLVILAIYFGWRRIKPSKLPVSNM
ncbi:MAG TPA: DUF4349 domain-containing protein [Ferruginibacter sp.]|nr:DUF4349 domain-containing protein [Ferruginibacter sp.]